MHLSLSASLALATLSLAPVAIAQSSNVAFIDSPSIINGGVLPTSGGDFNAFTFTNIAIGNVNAANLAAFDTVVLNIASPGMSCTTATLTATQKADLNGFVFAGGKLIIYDSECAFGGSVDYSWLDFPFSTVNPGATGTFGGTLTVAEENCLSSLDPLDPEFIDTTAITTQTDAVGDMNVVDLATVDPAWCLDMTGTNALNFTGAVHMYAPSGTGVVIYNGLDVDFITSAVSASGPGQLAKIWLQELQTSISSTCLPCITPVNGITLTPTSATNNVGTPHTVTATVGSLGVPAVGVLVTFTVVSGPNMGITGVCNPASCMTDASGSVDFTYTGGMTTGTDVITASFFDQLTMTTVTSQPATKTWVSECFLMLGVQEGAFALGPDTDDTLRVLPLAIYPVLQGNVPALWIPNNPGLIGLDVSGQVLMYSPAAYPNNPLQLSNGWRITIGVGAQVFGHLSNVVLTGDPFPALGQDYHYSFVIQ